MRANSMAKKFQKRDVRDFWKEVKVINISKVPLPASIEGVVGAETIVKLWREYYRDIFNCVERQEFEVGYVPSDIGVIIRPSEVNYAIEKLAVNVALQVFD